MRRGLLLVLVAIGSSFYVANAQTGPNDADAVCIACKKEGVNVKTDRAYKKYDVDKFAKLKYRDKNIKRYTKFAVKAKHQNNRNRHVGNFNTKKRNDFNKEMRKIYKVKKVHKNRNLN